MSNDEIRKLLDQLRNEIQTTNLDDETRASLEELDADIDGLLNSDDAESEPALDRIRAFEADIASEHPTTVRILNEIIAALSRMGI